MEGDGENNYESLMKNLEFTEEEWHKCKNQNMKLMEKNKKIED